VFYALVLLATEKRKQLVPRGVEKLGTTNLKRYKNYLLNAFTTIPKAGYRSASAPVV
jgi:hypothetical protein